MAKFAVGAIVKHKSGDIKGVIDVLLSRRTGRHGIASSGIPVITVLTQNTNFARPLLMSLACIRN